MKLSKKTILITGGTSGIGLELARQLLERGNVVIVTGRDPARLAAAKGALPALHTVQSDVSDPSAIDALCADLVTRFPALDVLINNAGIMRNLSLLAERDLLDLTREIEINLSGPVRMVQRLLAHLKTRPEAMIVNVSSGLAFVPMTISPIYSATKAALHAYSQCLRAQLGDTSITVVELAPPGVETPLFRGEFERETQGQKAMPVAVLAAKAIAGIEAGKLEIRPGLSNVLRVMSRVAPGFIFRQLTNMSKPKTSGAKALQAPVR